MATSEILEIAVKATTALAAVLCVSAIAAGAIALWLLHETHKEKQD